MHDVRPIHRSKGKKRIGRGGKRGTYSGRGQKGQKARAGAKIRPMERELILRIPKRRGLGFSRPRRVVERVALPLARIAERFQDGEVVSPETLRAKGLITARGGRMPKVKLVGAPELKKKLTVEGCALSAGARKAVEAAGGSIK